MILEFLREKTLVVDDDNSVKNAIDIPKGQIQFIFWSNSSSSTLLQTSLLRGELVGWGINGGYGTNTILSAKKTSHVEQPPPGAFVCIRDDDDDVLKHFSSFFSHSCFWNPFFLTDQMPQDNISRPLEHKRLGFLTESTQKQGERMSNY